MTHHWRRAVQEMEEGRVDEEEDDAHEKLKRDEARHWLGSVLYDKTKEWV